MRRLWVRAMTSTLPCRMLTATSQLPPPLTNQSSWTQRFPGWRAESTSTITTQEISLSWKTMVSTRRRGPTGVADTRMRSGRTRLSDTPLELLLSHHQLESSVQSSAWFAQLFSDEQFIRISLKIHSVPIENSSRPSVRVQRQCNIQLEDLNSSSNL